MSTDSSKTPGKTPGTLSNKDEIRQQFGKNAAAYATSKPHARGKSLARLTELIDAQPTWNVLDVATAAGHTAFAFAPRVARVWATDITDEMLALAKKQAQERSLDNVTVEYADAEDLPYDDASFDLLTCRIAAHHFVEVGPFMAQAVRVLQPGGILAVVDNVVPHGPPGAYVNGFEKLRDPSHGRCLSMDEWRQAFTDAGLELTHEETITKQMDFEAWAARHDTVMQSYLRALLSEASGEAAAFLQPHTKDGKTTFHLREGLLIGRKQAL